MERKNKVVGRIRQGVSTHKPEIVKKSLGGDGGCCRQKVAVNKGSLKQSRLYQGKVQSGEITVVFVGTTLMHIYTSLMIFIANLHFILNALQNLSNR